MKSGAKVLCICSPKSWKRNAKNPPKKGWVYLVKNVAVLDENQQFAEIGVDLAITLEGVESRDHHQQAYPASNFRLVDGGGVPLAKARRRK